MKDPPAAAALLPSAVVAVAAAAAFFVDPLGGMWRSVVVGVFEAVTENDETPVFLCVVL